MLIANGIRVFVDSTGDFVPTPAVSRAIIQYNAERTAELADGIILTPSHNPPDCGGIKYNPVTGGPADGDITGKIEAEANRLLANRNKDVNASVPSVRIRLIWTIIAHRTIIRKHMSRL